MKIYLHSSSIYIRALIIAPILAVLSYFLFPLLQAELSSQTAFAFGTGAGALIAVLLANLRIENTKEITADSQDDTCSVFVGNLAYRASREDLAELFSQYGTVHSVRIMADRMTRRPRGFGFVEMGANAAQAAIKALDGMEFHGRQLKVNEGKSRDDRAD
ncbi:MAG: hypothetical protein WCX90_05715 [Thiohalomonadaceae bacterium]